MKKITKTGYQAEDGSEFDTEFECRIYELVGDTSDIYDIVEILDENKKEILELLKEDQDESDDQWYYLKPGEKIQEGDEFLGGDGFWIPCSSSIGNDKSRYQYITIRRKKPAYYYLKTGDEIQQGDEYLNSSYEWVSSNHVGYQAGFILKYRRKL